MRGRRPNGWIGKVSSSASLGVSTCIFDVEDPSRFEQLDCPEPTVESLWADLSQPHARRTQHVAVVRTQWAGKQGANRMRSSYSNHEEQA